MHINNIEKIQNSQLMLLYMIALQTNGSLKHFILKMINGVRITQTNLTI